MNHALQQSVKQSVMLGILLAILIIPSLMTRAFGIAAPLHSGPFQDVNANGIYDSGDLPGQSKTGNLIIGGSSSYGSGEELTSRGLLQITRQTCVSGRPCSAAGSAPELRVLIGNYLHGLVIGSVGPSSLFTGSALDVRGSVKTDPAPAYLNYPVGDFYTDGSITSATDKRICATSVGDLITCPPGTL